MYWVSSVCIAVTWFPMASLTCLMVNCLYVLVVEVIGHILSSSSRKTWPESPGCVHRVFKSRKEEKAPKSKFKSLLIPLLLVSSWPKQVILSPDSTYREIDSSTGWEL